MKPTYTHQTAPLEVPTTNGKSIREHFGLQSTGDARCSVAKMVAPPGWHEPAQRPAFDEYTLMVSGRKQVEIGGETVVLNPGESLLVSAGTRVRYANPFQEAAEYWSVCLPAFSPTTVNREEG